jgi:hypothetical protein
VGDVGDDRLGFVVGKVGSVGDPALGSGVPGTVVWHPLTNAPAASTHAATRRAFMGQGYAVCIAE